LSSGATGEIPPLIFESCKVGNRRLIFSPSLRIYPKKAGVDFFAISFQELSVYVTSQSYDFLYFEALERIGYVYRLYVDCPIEELSETGLYLRENFLGLIKVE
jgi:hypothetical protein